jgi:hypothetical protein
VIEPTFSMYHSQLVNKQSLALNFNKKMLKMERRFNLTRGYCQLAFMYIVYLIKYCSQDVIMTLISKNEIELVTRYISEYEPDIKQIVQKIKSRLLV